MTNLKRYDVENGGDMGEYPDGAYVRYDDIKHLIHDEPAEERTPIDSPSEICPLLGCKRRDDHQHVVVEHPNRPAEPT